MKFRRKELMAERLKLGNSVGTVRSRQQHQLANQNWSVLATVANQLTCSSDAYHLRGMQN